MNKEIYDLICQYNSFIKHIKLQLGCLQSYQDQLDNLLVDYPNYILGAEVLNDILKPINVNKVTFSRRIFDNCLKEIRLLSFLYNKEYGRDDILIPSEYNTIKKSV